MDKTDLSKLDPTSIFRVTTFDESHMTMMCIICGSYGEDECLDPIIFSDCDNLFAGVVHDECRGQLKSRFCISNGKLVWID